MYNLGKRKENTEVQFVLTKCSNCVTLLVPTNGGEKDTNVEMVSYIKTVGKMSHIFKPSLV